MKKKCSITCQSLTVDKPLMWFMIHLYSSQHVMLTALHALLYKMIFMCVKCTVAMHALVLEWFDLLTSCSIKCFSTMYFNMTFTQLLFLFV